MGNVRLCPKWKIPQSPDISPLLPQALRGLLKPPGFPASRNRKPSHDLTSPPTGPVITCFSFLWDLHVPLSLFREHSNRVQLLGNSLTHPT